MTPETLRALIKALRSDTARTAKEVTQAGPFSDCERVRKWLEDLVFAGLVERVDIRRESKGRSGKPNMVGYRLKNGPEN